MNQPIDARVSAAFASREGLGEDFFGGWLPEDLTLFNKYFHPGTGSPGYITDFIGMKTATAYLPWAIHLDGGVVSEPPIPDDGLRAEAIEYFSLFKSFEQNNLDSFVAVELGSSYAPWACAAGLIAKRLGKKSITLRAVEASSYFHRLILKNFADNDLFDSPSVQIDAKAIRAAVANERGTMFFPVVQSAFENGGAATLSSPEVDYVGRKVEHEEVPVITLTDLFDGINLIDIMHCDIQGAEADVLIPSIKLLTENVKHIFIGTHSRKIEGDLLECLHSNGWHLLRERPTKFSHRPDLSSVTGMTTRDGGQFWINPKLVQV